MKWMKLKRVLMHAVKKCKAIMKKHTNRGKNMNCNEMEWRYVKELESENLIKEFEQLVGYELPADFKECIHFINGGRPQYQDFDTEFCEGRDIMAICSFNKDDPGSIWDSYEWDEECEEFEGFTGRYIPFAYSDCGDDICFDTSNNHIVYIDHEEAEVEKIANTFTGFINSLYEYDDEY